MCKCNSRQLYAKILSYYHWWVHFILIFGQFMTLCPIKCTKQPSRNTEKYRYFSRPCARLHLILTSKVSQMEFVGLPSPDNNHSRRDFEIPPPPLVIITGSARFKRIHLFLGEFLLRKDVFFSLPPTCKYINYRHWRLIFPFVKCPINVFLFV